MKKAVLFGVAGVAAVLALLLTSSAGAEEANGPALSWDPGLGLPRTQVQKRFKLSTLSAPVDVYEWGSSDAPSARLLAASDDPTSFVAFVPPLSGDVQTILARGTGPMTDELVAFVLRKAATA